MNKEKVKRFRVKTVILIAVFVILVAVNCFFWNEKEVYNSILLIVISIYAACIIFCFLNVLVEGIFYIEIPQKDDVLKSEIEKIVRTTKSWKFFNLIWLSTYWVLTALPILFSIMVVFVANYEPDDGTEKVILYSVLSLSMTTISAVIRPKEQAYGYRVAFERLNGKLLLFSSGQCQWKDVLDTVIWGEKGITYSAYDTIDTNSKDEQNSIRYISRAERRARNHKLITRGAAVEHLWPQVKPMTEGAFFELMEAVLALPEAQSILQAHLPKTDGDP